MRAINKLSLATMLGVLAVSPGVYSADAPDISGSYKCSYHDPFTTPNDGTETVVFKKNGDVYKISGIPTGSVFPYYIGKGIMNKNVPNAIGYIFWQPKSPTVTTIQIFTIKPDGSLDGVFAESNKDKGGTETCTKSAQQ
ncbi:hypothetical protein OQJ18_08400 [Fluoribacter dumoffii]|uniref:Uncharacterized protein n=1 Tax=Fluoribacter dumoffii TaxID=463 RepID=A0A377G7X8_9GAMM|nr:hypothetical protein [Fluoribacter dumoffii]KTC89628.1 hypothetical protein Ldum_0696 [Fluoribacter dumoffii NY 23]MCW8384821.1 hypothetical protein [Fluoribacter dumoffii]MCW8417884.1 hypothetical protein [Fluoribacter dumoffii]MCW8454274.1 hypothetical protein [Fluoribacter dumoffii]MCW8461652.1 hypothetical protein [Fluoribacter dumoffii]